MKSAYKSSDLISDSKPLPLIHCDDHIRFGDMMVSRDHNRHSGFKVRSLIVCRRSLLSLSTN